MSVTNSHLVTIKVEPWETKGFKIDLLHVWEKLGENQPGGHMELSHDGNQEALDFITSQQTGKIEILDENDGGQYYSFGFFISRREFINNKIKLDFLIIPENDLVAGKNFYTRPRSETYNSPAEALDAVWPGKDRNQNPTIFKNVETNINTAVHQDNETGYSFLSRICGGWKFKSVYSFSWDGLIIRDIGDDIKSDIVVNESANLWSQTNITPLKYSSLNNNELFNPWTNDNKDNDQSISKSSTGGKDFNELKPKYVTSSISRDSYKIHAVGYDDVEKNLKRNTEFKGYSCITITAEAMPKDWKIGDVVNYKKVDQNNTDKTEKDLAMRCVVAANELFFSQSGASCVGPNGKPFEWTTLLWGLDELDINKEIENNTQNNG